MSKIRGRVLAVSEPVRGLLNFATLHLDRDLFEPEDIGHKEPIMVLPGYQTSDAYTYKLRQFLTDLNYTVYGWSQGKNQARTSQFHNVQHKLVEIYEHHKTPVKLIGYSLGGLYARKLAQEHPHIVDSVITVGTPISWEVETDIIKILTMFGMMSGADPELLNSLSKVDLDPKVHTTIIYSREDGVVHWHDAMNKKPSANVKHIRVSGAHMGMIHNASVWRAIKQSYINA